MKKYVKAVEDIPTLKQTPTESELYDFLNFTDISNSDDYFNTYAVLRGNDVILDTKDGDMDIYYNAGKYLNEFLNSIDDFEQYENFMKTHSDVETESTSSVWDILN